MGHFLYTLIIYPLVQIIEFAFLLFDDVFKIEGISVIGVSFAVSLLCLPLYIVAERWQQIQRDTEKRLEPGVKRIKETFKGDEQYMILSTFYRENHYHPMMALRSSFGLLIQIPFFIAAYNFLSSLPILQGESFLFIRDLGKPDAIFTAGGFPINILPILMTLINIIAGAIYTKGFKAKDKIQIYGMALVFLVVLYNSPAGLVLYWTMNNVFSLVKNIFYKIKNPLKVLYILMAVFILFLDFYVLFIHEGLLHKRLLLVVVASSLLLLPFAVKTVNRLLDSVLKPVVDDKKLRFSIFITSALALCLLTGFVIPSYIIKSSVIEFSGIDGYGSPLIFLYTATLQMLGLLVFWPACVYFLFHNRIQTLIASFLTILLFSGLVNAFCFSGDYGVLSRLITFSQSISSPSKTIILLNILAVLFAILLPFVLVKIKQSRILTGILSVILLALFGVTAVHSIQIQSEYRTYKSEIASDIQEASSISPVYHLSKTGKNVVVFMLDRAENSYVTPIFEAFPELYDTFTGFTYYKNTISYNAWTLLGCPGLYGGYEYIPKEMNARTNEKLIDKHNQALLLMPRVFTEQADFTATCSDLSWANFSWIADMSICNPYPKITGLNIERKYTSLWVKQNPDKVKGNITSNAIMRNLVWFSLFKEVPTFVRDAVYQDGHWWSSDEQTSDVMEYIDYYSGLAFLPQLTDFTAETNTYTTIVNETPHSNTDLQAPNYDPAIKVTNKGPEEICDWHAIDSNIATYKRIADWINWLKENDCYDNTRIILVSDHGCGTKEGYNLDFEKPWPFDYNPDHNHPILFVKDFNAGGKMVTNMDFMTNADVPSLAFKDIIEHPKNPFTGKEILPVPLEGKKASGIVLTHTWSPGANNINSYRVPDEDWYTVSDNIFEAKNWQQGIK